MSQRIIENEISTMGGKFDSPAMASNIIVPNAEGVNYPVVHELGSDTYSDLVGSTDITLTPITDGYNCTVGGVETSATLTFATTTSTSASDVLQVSFTAVVDSGTFTIDQYFNGTSYVPLPNGEYTVINGINNIEVGGRDGSPNQLLRSGKQVSSDIDITFIGVKQITLPTASYLTYFDAATEKLKQISATGDINNSNFQDTFDTNIDNWSPYANGVAVWENGELFTTRPIGEAATAGYFQTIPLKIGQKYKISIYTRRGTNNTSRIALLGGLTATLDSSSSEGEILSYTGIATENYVNIVLRAYTPEGTSAYYDNVVIKELLPISTVYNIKDPHQFVFNHTRPLTDAEKADVELYPNLIYDVWFNGAVLQDGFSKIDIGNFFEPNKDGAYVQDLSVANTPVDGFTGTTSTASTNGTNTFDGVDTFNIIVTEGSHTTRPNVSLTNGNSIGQLFHIVHTITVNSGQAYINNLAMYNEDGSSNGTNPFGQLLEVGTYVFNTITYRSTTGANSLSFNSINAPIGNFSVKIKYFPLTATEILGAYTSANRLYNQNVGASNFLLEEDASGRKTGTSAVGVYRFANNDGRNMALGLKLNLERWSMLEEISGEIQNFGSELLTQPIDLTNWTIANANATIVDANNFTTSDINSGVFKTGLGLVQGKTYAFHFIGTTTSTNLEIIDGGVSISETIHLGGGAFNKIVTIKWDSSNLNPLIWNVIAGDTTITSLSIKELTTKTQRQVERVITHDEGVLGDEEATDGIFDSTARLDSYVYSNGDLQATLTHSTDTNGYIIIAFQAVVGKKYRFSLVGNIAFTVNTYCRIYDGVNTETYTNTGTINTEYIEITAESTEIKLYLYANLTTVTYSFSVKEIFTEDKLYIDKVLQAETPVLPNPTVAINPADTAILGYPDKITARHDDILVSSEAWTQAEIDAL